MKGINALAAHKKSSLSRFFAILVSIFWWVSAEVYTVAKGAFCHSVASQNGLSLTNTFAFQEHYSCLWFVQTKWGFGAHLILRQITKTRPKLTKVQTNTDKFRTIWSDCGVNFGLKFGLNFVWKIGFWRSNPTSQTDSADSVWIWSGFGLTFSIESWHDRFVRRWGDGW